MLYILKVSSVRIYEDDLDEQLRALLAVVSMNRKSFNKMVKETKKKSHGQIEELQVEIESTSFAELNDIESKEQVNFRNTISLS